jgi:hypothetical protein
MSHSIADRRDESRLRRLVVRVSSAIALIAVVMTGVTATVASADEPTYPSEPTFYAPVAAPDGGLNFGEVRLNWKPPTSDGGAPILDYYIEYAEEPQEPGDHPPVTRVDDGVSTATTYTVKGLTSGVRYWFWVGAINRVGAGPASWEVKAKPLGPPPALRVRLNESVKSLTPDELRVDWTGEAKDGGSPVTDWTFERSNNGGATWAEIGLTNEPSGLTVGTRYWFRIARSNKYGQGPWSNVVSGVPGKPVPVDVIGSTFPTPGVKSREVKLDWTTPSAGSPITDYIIVQREWLNDGGARHWSADSVVDDGVSAATSFTVTGLTNGAQYEFEVKGRNAIGDGAFGDPTLVTPDWWPGTPVDLAAFAVRAGEVKLTWNAPADGGSGIYDYVIQRSTDGTNWTTVFEPISSLTTATVTGLTQGTSYQFRIQAYNQFGSGPWTTPITAVAPTRPAAPTGLKAAAGQSGTVKLTWDAAPAGTLVDNYYVDYCCEAGEWVAADDGTLTATTLTVGGLTDGTSYQFRLAANNPAGASSWSPTVSATAGGPPPAPTGLTTAVVPAAGAGSGQVKLTWTAPTAGSAITDYVIEYSTDGLTWTTANDGVSSATTATVSNLVNFTSYQFRVATKNAYGAGERSAVVTATPAGQPAAPTGLRAAVDPAVVSAGQVRLTWDASPAAAAVTGYVIEASTDGTTWTSLADGATSTTFLADGLIGGTPYSFRVSAKNAFGVGQASIARATPLGMPAAPSGVSAAAGPSAGLGSGEAQVLWTAPTVTGGAPITDYVVEMSTDGNTWRAVDEGVSTDTSLILRNLTNGTTYSFRVAAETVLGRGSWSAIASVTAEGYAEAPAGLAAAVAPANGVGPGEVELSWIEPDGGGLAIVDYVVESSVDGTTWHTVVDGLAATTSAKVTGLVNGTTYHLRVAAVTGVGPGATATVDATPAWTPAAVGGLHAAVAPVSGVRSGQVKLTWIATSDNGNPITDYVIQRSPDGTTWTLVDDGVSTATTSTVSGLTNGKAYQFRVAPVNAIGQGEWSTTTNATPRWKPAAPGRLRAVAGSRRVTLSWAAPASNGSVVTDYVIQRSTGTTWTTLRDGVSTARSFTVLRLANGTAYRFRVAAKNVVGQGAWGAVVRATPQAR